MEVCPYSYFRWCGYFWGPWVSFVLTDEFSVRVTKYTTRIGVSWNHSLPFCFWSIFNWMKCPFYPKDVNQITLKTHNSLKLSFTNVQGLCSNFVEYESFHESNTPDVLALCEANFDGSIDSGNFCEGLSSFNPKALCYSYACFLSEGKTSFWTGLISRYLCGFLLMLWTGFTGLPHLLKILKFGGTS